jgi:hypothetical protein
MQIEEQNQAVISMEIVPQADSKDSKRSHGGKRPGCQQKAEPRKARSRWRQWITCELAQGQSSYSSIRTDSRKRGAASNCLGFFLGGQAERC